MTQAAQSPAAPPARNSVEPKLKFHASEGFLGELKKRVDAYFQQTGRRRRDCPQMYFKTATIMSCFVAAYVLLLFFAASWWTVLPLAVILGLSLAAIGFNIQHDGGHKAYSDRPWVNKLMSLTIDLIGGSSYLWAWKHNTFHHTFTNVAGHDDDISIGILGQLSPHQKRYAFHRAQCVYLWFLYGFLAIKWHLVDDFYSVAIGRIGSHKIPRPRGTELLIFIGGKIAFFSLAFVIPMLLHPIWAVLAVYAFAAFISGVVMSVVFQLAHCVEDAEFPEPIPAPGGGQVMPTDWAVHQVQTTVDFARGNWFLYWYLGGLNFQIEHHLFHGICHIHYPALSKVVEEVCRDFGIRYAAQTSFHAAIASHFRWLVAMGRPTPLTN